MKNKYWMPVILLLFLVNLLLIVGCNQKTAQTTQPISSPVPTVTSASSVPVITAPDAYQLIQKNIGNPNFVILDVRTADEFNSGYITGAINIDYYSSDFQATISKLDKNKQYLIYCKAGVRGEASTRIMMDLGFESVQNLTGGITAWIQAGYPVTTLSSTTTIIPPTTTSTTISAPPTNGLRLQLSVSTTNPAPGVALQIKVSEYNTLSTTNNVAAENSWAVSNLALGPCKNTYVQPFGVALFQGHFTKQNISLATALGIFPLVPCPLFIRQVTGFLFLPDSINAAVLPGGDISSPTPMSAEVTVTGIFAQGTQSHPLDPGDYTIVAGDEWGTLEFLYIDVN